MYQSLDKNLLSVLEEKEEEAFPIARIIEEGRDKGFVTLDDIMQQFPEAERSVDQLEEVFAALLSAGIPYNEDAPEDEMLTMRVAVFALIVAHIHGTAREIVVVIVCFWICQGF